MSAFARALVAAVVLLTGGCSMSAGNNATVLATKGSVVGMTPAEWTAGGQGADGDIRPDWWTELGDPQLDRLITEALANNFDLQQAAARVLAAQGEARIAGADLYPQLQGGLSGARSRQVFTGLPVDAFTPPCTEEPCTPPCTEEPCPPATTAPSGPLSSTSNNFGVSLDLSWELDLWGRIRATERAAAAEAEAARIAYDGARLSLAAQTAKAWFALVEAREQLALAEATQASYRRSSEHVTERYERGTRSPLDVRLSLTQTAAADARVAQRRAVLERTARQLEVLIGRYPAAEIEPTGVLDYPVVAVPAGVPAELLARRPDLAEAEQRVFAADRRLYAAKASLLPRFAITGSAGTVSDDVADLLDGDFAVWTIAANMVQPIFQGGRLRGAVARADAGTHASMAEYASIALRAFAEVESALADERHLDAVVDGLARAAEQSAAAEELATERYYGGLESYVTVLQAQRDSLTARSTLLEARRQRLETRIDLYLSLGGGFAASAPTAAAGPADSADQATGAATAPGTSS